MSETTKHTAGPWTVRTGAVDSVIHATGANGTIASVFGYTIHGSGTKSLLGPQRDANAALIAAAPELLAAAQALMRFYGHLTPSSDPSDPWTMLRAAVAKAEGRTS